MWTISSSLLLIKNDMTETAGERSCIKLEDFPCI